MFCHINSFQSVNQIKETKNSKKKAKNKKEESPPDEFQVIMTLIQIFYFT